MKAGPSCPLWNSTGDAQCRSSAEPTARHAELAVNLTNAFSKKWGNLWAALCLHFAYYNFCRVHSALRTTPAMASGIAMEIWPLERLLC
jgi:hypothetical protein